MNKNIKKLWVEALRSGDYEQAKFDLRKKDKLNGQIVGYCCLGVLTDIYCNKKGSDFDRVAKKRSYLPVSVSKWAGFGGNDNPSVAGNSLAALNDGAHGSGKQKSFVEIADLIEAHL